jgi:hypothetical protein
MRIERAALVILLTLNILSGYTLYVASSRFGDATESFDAIDFELESFAFERGSTDVRFQMSVGNGGPNTLQISGLEYSFVVSGVLAGGGDDLESTTVIEQDTSETLDLVGRVTDETYVERLPTDEPINWLVRGRILVNVDPRLDSTWIGFAFRVETP